MTIRRLGALLMMFGCMGTALPTQAEYPDRPIKLVSPFPAGAGAVDLAARVIAKGIEEKLNSTVVVTYQPGAAGNIAAGSVVKAPKDGYTLLFGTAAMLGYAKILNKDLPYDPFADFTPLALIGSVPVGLFVNAKSDIKSLPDLIAAAKAKPGAITFSSPGIGSVTHVAMEILMARTGIKLSHVPYGAQASYWTDLAGGDTIQAVAGGITGGLPLVKSGRIRLIATLTQQRTPFTPDTPAAGEAVPGYDAPAWLGLAVTSGTPEAIVAKLEAATQQVLQDPELKTVLGRSGIYVEPATRQEFTARLAREKPVWEATLRNAGLMAK